MKNSIKPKGHLNYILVAILIMRSSFLAAQVFEKRSPEINKKCPKYTFKDIQYFSKPSSSIQDFSGKWLIIDFWSINCAGCISSFPKYDEMQKRLKDDVQVLLVGYNSKHSDKNIRSLFSRIREKQHINLIVAWDTTLFEKFAGVAVPYIIVIDPKGFVRAITSEIKEQDMRQFIKGEIPDLPRYRTANNNPSVHYRYDLPLLSSGGISNGGNDTGFLYRSLFAKWNESMPINNSYFSSIEGKYEITGADLEKLYRVAYFGKEIWDLEDTLMYGKVSFDHIVETKDSLLLKLNGLHNRYSYSLIFPIHDVEEAKLGLKENLFFQMTLRQTLSSLFPYEATIELRPMPCYKLVVSDVTKLKIKTNGKKSNLFLSAFKFDVKNKPINFCAGNLLSETSYSICRMPIFDETGITYNVDLSLNCNMTDIKDIKNELLKNGLSLIESRREMKVLVIRDPKPQ